MDFNLKGPRLQKIMLSSCQNKEEIEGKDSNKENKNVISINCKEKLS